MNFELRTLHFFVALASKKVLENIKRLSRLLAIQTTLQSKRLITATEIAKRYGVSKRTIYRDIKTLEAAGLPIHIVEGKGYALVDGFSLPPVHFSDEEAHALITGHKFITRNKDASLVKHHQSAIDKVKAVLNYQTKETAVLLEQRIAFFNNFKNETTSDCLIIAQKAIADYKLLEIEYESLSKGKNTSRIIEPRALYHTQENWILIAYCRLRKANREFRLDKIQKLKLLEQHFENTKFDLLSYFLSYSKKK